MPHKPQSPLVIPGSASRRRATYAFTSTGGSFCRTAGNAEPRCLRDPSAGTRLARRLLSRRQPSSRADNASIKTEQLLFLVLPVERAHYELSTAFAHFLRLRRMLKHPLDRRSDRRDVARRHTEPAAVALDDRAKSGKVGGYHRQARRHVFKE